MQEDFMSFIKTIRPICKEIQSQQPQLSETMATAIALLAMAEFREKIQRAQKDAPKKELATEGCRASFARTLPCQVAKS
jgi:dihydroneopterin aldolase